MYFSKFPFILYDSIGNFDFKVVTNLLRRVALRANLREDTLVFDTYDVRDGETPEILAHKLYGDSELHWIILLVNNKNKGIKNIRIKKGLIKNAYVEKKITFFFESLLSLKNVKI